MRRTHDDVQHEMILMSLLMTVIDQLLLNSSNDLATVGFCPQGYLLS